jgi:hypothetical protein
MEKKMKKILINTTVTLLSSLILTGCGGDSNNTKHIDKTPVVTTKIDRDAKTHFGVLSDATVNIYQLVEGDRKLLFSEITSSGTTLDDIGNFNPHLAELEDKKFYLYEVTNGQNWDVDKDGNIDETPTANNNTYRSIKRGIKQHRVWSKSTSFGQRSVISGGLE